MQRAHRWNLKFMAFAVSHVSLSVRAARTRRRQTHCLPWKANYTREKEKIVTRRRCRRRQNESASPAFSSGRLSGWRMAFFMHFKAAHVAQPGHTPHHVRVSEWTTNTRSWHVCWFFLLEHPRAVLQTAGQAAALIWSRTVRARGDLRLWNCSISSLFSLCERERPDPCACELWTTLAIYCSAANFLKGERARRLYMKGQLSDSKALIQPPLDR
jgi:hypothetical protein